MRNLLYLSRGMFQQPFLAGSKVTIMLVCKLSGAWCVYYHDSYTKITEGMFSTKENPGQKNYRGVCMCVIRFAVCKSSFFYIENYRNILKTNLFSRVTHETMTGVKIQ